MSNAFISRRGQEVLVPAIDNYLIESSKADLDRAPDVISPSNFAKCIRAQYFMRTGKESDGGFIDPKTQRIFHNGDHMHLRVQEYLHKTGLLLMDEVPIWNEYTNVQGHTDGLLKIDDGLAVLELKSMRQEAFNYLTGPKPEHITQSIAYIYCLEKERLYLQETYEDALSLSFIYGNVETDTIAARYDHIRDGSKHTRKEKLNFILSNHFETAQHLYKCKNPISDVYFLYENKNTQDFKEYKLTFGEADFAWLEKRCKTIETAVKTKTLPDREGQSKSDSVCKYCDYKNACWG